MAERKENIVIFPFMAQGHIIPFLALALHIERQKGYSITFVNTPFNINKLRSSLPQNSSIRLLEIPFSSSDHGLPPNAENTDVLPYNLVIRLLEASTSLRAPFKKLLQDLIDERRGHKPLCVIADIFFGWTASAAKELGLFHAIFSGAGGFGLACYYSLWLNLPHKNTKVVSVEFSLPDFEEASTIHISQLPKNILEADHGEDPWGVFQKENLSAWFDSDGILFNTVGDFDQLGLQYFRRKLGRPVWSIGPLLLSSENRASCSSGETELCQEWLDSKPANSVLYVCFGSMNTVSVSQMMQLAMALEASCKNFIWVVRPPIGFDVNSEHFKANEWFPEGFEDRMASTRRGLLIQKWAPQVEILSHRAVSAFLTHCGWNSTLEALSHGVPLLGWPMAAEQFFNVMLLEKEAGVCVEVARGKSCEVRHEDLKAKIELVMNDTEKGNGMRRKAGELRERIKNAMKQEDFVKGSSIKAMDDFFQCCNKVDRGQLHRA